MRRFLSLLVLTTALGTCVYRGAAAPYIDADPNKDYPVVPQAGNWMICVAYYTGPEAADLSRQMAYQIRSNPKLGLPAYVYVHVDPELKQRKDELDRAHQKALELMRESGAQEVSIPKRTIRVEEQYAVLVGGWDKVEDANTYLKWLRAQEAPELRSATGRTTREMRFEVKEDPETKKWTYKQSPINPFTTATVTRNPTLPTPRVADRPDPFLKTLNEANEYSLLNCPRRYTLLVKEYLGASEMISHDQTSAEKVKQSGFLEKIGLSGAKEGKALEASAVQAHELARVLRKLNFDAYVLHTRTSSQVAVGGFDTPTESNIGQTARRLEELRQKMTAEARGELFVTPLLMEVPRP